MCTCPGTYAQAHVSTHVWKPKAVIRCLGGSLLLEAESLTESGTLVTLVSLASACLSTPYFSKGQADMNSSPKPGLVPDPYPHRAVASLM